jgi:hypothetical protein
MNTFPKILFSHLSIWALLGALAMASASAAQVSPPSGPFIVNGGPNGHPPAPPVVPGDNYERSLKVDPNLSLSLCVTQGNVKINGWNRNELRVFVQDGSKFDFKVQQSDPTTQTPAWVKITGMGEKNKYPTECIAGGDIEIDVPKNATITFKAKVTATIIDMVRKVNAKTSGGDISLRNISENVTASTYEGNLTAEECKGAMSLDTTTGNIVVFDAGPSEIGDTFSARTTSGAISLQDLTYRQIDANSISGSVSYSGEILGGGTYSLATSNGSIRLSLPQKTACSLAATYGFGTFNSEIPFKLQTENINGGNGGDVKNIVGVLGTGGTATLKLTTNNGTIGIRKL